MTSVQPGSRALFHIVDEAAWARARQRGEVRPTPPEDFVHCSYAEQVAGTLTRHFENLDGLLVLQLDASAIGSPIRVEDSYGRGASFPHVYGPIPVSAVTGVHAATSFTGD